MVFEDEQSRGGAQADGGGLHGRFDFLLDAKKRCSIPSDWRDAMGAPACVYILPDPVGPYLHLFPPDEMRRSFGALRNRELFDEDLDELLGIIGEHVDQVRLDVQGRIRVSDQMLAHAMIEDTVVLIGTQTRAQLWSLKMRPAVGAVNQVAFAEACRAYTRSRVRLLPPGR